MPRSRGTWVSAHGTPYARLVANVVEDEGCWLGPEKSSGRGGYLQVNFRIPGLGGRVHKFSAHVLTWVAHETGLDNMDDLFLAYLEFRASGLVIDHECERVECRRPGPGHLVACTQSENIRRGWARALLRIGDRRIEAEEALAF